MSNIIDSKIGSSVKIDEGTGVILSKKWSEISGWWVDVKIDDGMVYSKNVGTKNPPIISSSVDVKIEKRINNRICRTCKREIPPTGKRGRPPVRCDDCRRK